MAVRSSDVRQLTELELMAHLFRRAGFGARRDELEAALAKGYEATVEELLHPENQPELEHDLIYRYWLDIKESRQIDPAQSYWVYRMINTQRPLEEKMALFWHRLFATGFAKLNHPGNMLQQIAMFREHGLGNFRTLLVELSRDPAMIFWLDNQTNTNDVHNENYGRELLELFSMGIGNYTEDDVKNCARAFTGWTLKNADPWRASRSAASTGSSSTARTSTMTARRRSSARPATWMVRTSSTSSSSSRPLPGSSPGACTTSSSPTCRTRRRSTSWPRSSWRRSTTSVRSCGPSSCRTCSARRRRTTPESRARPSTSSASCGWSKISPSRGGASARSRSSAGTWARIS